MTTAKLIEDKKQLDVIHKDNRANQLDFVIAVVATLGAISAIILAGKIVWDILWWAP